MKLKKGDNVIVLSGNDKGKTGEVLSVIPKSEKVIVKGINVRKMLKCHKYFSLLTNIERKDT